nr:MAG TPA: hypothetical protein [Caudoviricetes sp.]
MYSNISCLVVIVVVNYFHLFIQLYYQWLLQLHRIIVF